MRLAYCAAAIIRVVLLLLSPLQSFIHPDEHFQCGEMAAHWTYAEPFARAGDHVGLFRPWEFAENKMARSSVSGEILCGIPFSVLGLFAVDPANQGWYRLVAIHAFSMLLATVNDFVMYQVIRIVAAADNAGKGERFVRDCLFVMLTSFSNVMFLTRPFSNALETFIVNLIIYLAFQSRMRNPITIAFLGGSLIGLGCFVRITFPAFAFGMVLFTCENQAYLNARNSKKYDDNRETRSMVAMFTTPALRWLLVHFLPFSILGFLTSSLACMALDSANNGWHVVIAPLNNLLYNMDSNNLALHGRHFRGTHLFVNMQILFGPMFPIAVFVLGKKIARDWQSQQDFNGIVKKEFALYATIFLGVMTLSIFPHQEPRFLLPLLLPVLLISAPYLSSSKPLMFLWIVFNMVSFVFWGFLHQGGLLSAMIFIGQDISLKMSVNPALGKFCVYGSHVYDLPRYLLGEAALRNTRVIDLRSDIQFSQREEKDCTYTYVVKPRSVPTWEVEGKQIWSHIIPHFNAELDTKFDVLEVISLKRD